MTENDKRIAAGGCWPPPDIRAALAAKNGPAKPLEWRNPTDHPQDGFGEENIVAVADGIGGRYQIRREQDGSHLLWWAHDEFLFLQCASVNGAKVAAEVDWQKRFAALLRPALSSGEPTPADAAPQARKSGQAREEQQNPPPKETTGKVEGES